jgi:hypothetical protein
LTRAPETITDALACRALILRPEHNVVTPGAQRSSKVAPLVTGIASITLSCSCFGNIAEAERGNRVSAGENIDASPMCLVRRWWLVTVAERIAVHEVG